MPYHKLKIPNSKLKILGIWKRKIWNLDFGAWSFSGGFTLIEFVVVLGILGFLLGSIMLFLNSTLRGANQTNITQEVKQNGQSVLDSLDKQIRGANDANGLGSAPFTTIVLTRPNDDPLYIKCLPATATQNDRIGAVALATGTPSDSNYISISNDDRVKGIEITDCSFSVTSKSASSQVFQNPAVVSVQFTASQGLDAPTRADFMASAHFETTISLRAY